ncbi:histidine phosphatase family protein [Bacillus pseudomycoides]|uniref:histidine phosphatase family protein n=1 Tax=Bacillus TaxID=1386 RepID=UPI0022498DA7|nr:MULTISPECIES: histidine phosphatase family protein [Bacillus]MCX2829736.1 histidine phosphatase family protein [Bacillus sp. DHT2]MDR4918837.1 histidine phosphatase family protein [Bacillus pseudomycoides]
MVRIFLVRHGETEGIRAGRMEARLDSPLTTLGIQQAQAVALKLNEEQLHSIYTSPSLRAVKTAEIIMGDKELSLIKDKALYEMDIGFWDGKKPNEIKRDDSDRFKDFSENPELFRPNPDRGESFEDVQNRAFSFLNRIIKDHENQNILVVSHTVVLKLIMCHFKRKNIKNFWDPPIIQNGSLSLVHIHHDEVLVELDSDISHLQSITII